MKTLKLPALFGVAVLGLFGCANKLVKKTAPVVQQEESTASQTNEEPSMRSALPRSIPELKAVRFAYDSAFLDRPAELTLRQNAEWINSHPKIEVQVAGHCDQRGTAEYNLALGQRRAQNVRNYYRHMGVAGNRIATISYGKERPLCQEAKEICWKKNRRAETLEVLPQAVGRAPNKENAP